jgi:hypothetical protein
MKGVNTMATEKANKAESINLADVTKQVEAMLAKAREEAAKIVADAKASVSGELTEEQKKANEERKAYWNEPVEVKLFKDNNKYKDDVYVSVNDENCLIKRGERVMVKRKFADVLDKSDMQDYETSKLIEKKSNEFAKSEF